MPVFKLYIFRGSVTAGLSVCVRWMFALCVRRPAGLRGESKCGSGGGGTEIDQGCRRGSVRPGVCIPVCSYFAPYVRTRVFVYVCDIKVFVVQQLERLFLSLCISWRNLGPLWCKDIMPLFFFFILFAPVLWGTHRSLAHRDTWALRHLDNSYLRLLFKISFFFSPFLPLLALETLAL